MMDYVLADDLSGALETGAVFRSAGRRVTLPLNPAAPAGVEGGVEVVTSETRGEPAERAEGIVRSIIAGRREAGQKPLFKKIDSTMRGPIGAELRAVISELSPPLIAFCPANPAAGRTVHDGLLSVRGVPLAVSDFRSDPQWPAKSSRVAEILESQGVEVGATVSLDELRDPESTAVAHHISSGKSSVFVFDAETDTDLGAIVNQVGRSAPGALFVGSAAMAAPVARELADQCSATGEPALPRLGSLLFVCGSGHPVSHRQMEFLRSSTGVRVDDYWIGETNEEDLVRGSVASLERSGAAGVRLDSHGSRTPANARMIQEAAGGIVRKIVERFVPNSLFVTGGETAWTVCRALGGQRLEVLCELQPGVVVSRFERGSEVGINVITKPGGYGGDATLVELIH